MIMADFVLDCGDWCEIQRFCVDFGVFFAKMAGYGGNWRGNNGNSREIRRVHVDMCKIWMTPFAGPIGCLALCFSVSVREKRRKSGRFVLFLRFRCTAVQRSIQIAQFPCSRAQRRLLATPRPTNHGFPDFPACARPRIAAGNLESPHWSAQKPLQIAQFPCVAHGGNC